MSQQDHDLKGSVVSSDDLSAITIPASPPRRLSMEDADSSLTRKRPRLDNGSADNRPMPADSPPDVDPYSTHLAEQPREMTIRSQLPSSSQTQDTAADIDPQKDTSFMDVVQSEPITGLDEPIEAQFDGGDDVGVSSPPVLAIDDDDEYASIRIEYDEEDYFRKFPFASSGFTGPPYMGALRQMITHFHGANALDGTVLPQVTAWLDRLPASSSQWRAYYIDKQSFWDEFANFVNKVLVRRHTLGDSFCNDTQNEEQIITLFFRSYVRLCARLLQVDAYFLSHHNYEDVYEQNLLIWKHLRHLNSIFRAEKTALFAMLAKEYAADVREMSTAIMNEFLDSPTDGAKHLFRAADAACRKLPSNISMGIAVHVTFICISLGWHILDVSPLPRRSRFNHDVLAFFRQYDAEMQTPSKVIDVTVVKELLGQFAVLLSELCHWDEDISVTLVDEFLDFGSPDSPSTAATDAETTNRLVSFRQDRSYFHILVSSAWRFKLLKKYVVKGRMELRVMSIGAMDDALVNIWRDYHLSELQTNHPVMQYLADFLLHEKVVDYIISVDSHPQIISRSGNIVGFLIVTHRYSDSQTDAIWQTLTHSPDPRVVLATIKMLLTITNLMYPAELQYFFTKIYDIPVANISMDLLRFLRELTQKSQQKPVNWSSTNPKARPWNVCVRMIQDTSPSRDSGKALQTLHDEACDQLLYLSSTIDETERHLICLNCIEQISTRSRKATGSVHAILILVSNSTFSQIGSLLKDENILRPILEELCFFVDTETSKEYPPSYTTALQYRLDLLRNILVRATEFIPSDLYKDLWDHTVGKFVLNPTLRDWAWLRFAEVIKNNPHNECCKDLVFQYIPKLKPEFFTTGMFEFVTAYKFKLVQNPDGAIEAKGGSQKFSDDLLWRMVLLSPPHSIEDRAAKFLATRYLEINTEKGVTLEEVEETHVALVEKCIKELLLAFQTLRNKQRAPAGMDDAMDVVLSSLTRQETELRFSRMVLFVKLLLSEIRSKPQFYHSGRSDSKVEMLEADLPAGDPIEISYQVSATNERRAMMMGSENTFHDLYMRLCHSTGLTRLNIFHSGQRLVYDEKKASTLAEIGLQFHAHLLVQKAAGSETRQPGFDSKAPQSAFEIAFTEHLDELFVCMDSDDRTSSAIFELLSSFPFRERIVNEVMSDTRSSQDIFPPHKPYQVKYAAFALQNHLREQVRKGSLDDVFLMKAVNVLGEALLDQELFDDSLCLPTELDLINTLVSILLEFLKERPSQDISSVYFPNEVAIVHRLVKILQAALRNNEDCAGLVVNAYSTIIEASLHSRGIWDSFVNHPDASTLHKSILLVDPRKSIRQAVGQSIASVCGGDLPFTSPLDRTETASHFWTIIATILPDTMNHQKQSEQLFSIAEQVFRDHDEHSRNEESLRSYLMIWSDLLLRYKHEEFVGRDDVDFVVLGFTRLLLCCIPSLKSFKKPLNVGSLMERIFEKFLFIPRICEMNDDDTPHDLLPVLESKTRRELYDLIIALAEDRNSYNLLLQLADGLGSSEDSASLRSYAVDRLNEIRSSTGYVGLVNPRAICYMNSLLTQLFMNVNFRKFMLELNVADGSGSQRLLSETQKLFGIMQNTFRKSADPREFASCVKGLEGAPIDINIQMDADEFYNLLFDQWEGQMLSPETRQRFRSFYGGQTVNQIKSMECEHVSERVESFFVVQCDVQGKANLQESLQAFVEGDVMEGDNKYKCESCGGRFVDAVKRTCLKDVPDNLIFHLKRFDFDLVEMRRAKINDLFQFPDSIDISSYHVDHLTDPSKPRQEDIFDLVGVLVHQGTSENGHYYSYIRERPCPTGGAENWVEFNDRDVDTFDVAGLPYQAFGGFYEDQYQRTQKQFSAYMLFYQRRTAIEKDHQQYISSPLCGAPKVSIPPQLESDINEDNDSFIREYSLHDPNHSRFVRQLLRTLRTVNTGSCSETHRQEEKALHIALDHVCRTICRQRNIEEFEETMLQIRKTALSCPDCCHITLKWLSSSDVALTNFFLRCLHPKVRSQVRAFLIDGLRMLRERDPALYGMETTDTDMETGTAIPNVGVLPELVLRFRAVVDESWISARGWDDLYLTLCQIAHLGYMETAVLLNNDMLEFPLKVLSMPANPTLSQSEPDMRRLIDKRKPMFNRLTELVYTLLSKVDVNAKPRGRNAQDFDRLELYDRNTGKFPLSHMEYSIISTWDENNRALAVLDKMIESFDRSRTEVFYPGEVLKLLLQSQDLRLQRNILHTVVEGVSCLNPPYSDPYVRAALSYCEGSSETHLVLRVFDTVINSAVSLRAHGGDSHLEFFNGVLLAYINDTSGQKTNPDTFYNFLFEKIKTYAMALLVYENDVIRKATANHLEDVFKKVLPDESLSDDTLRHKHLAMRKLILELMTKIAIEHENHTPRSYMQPMIASCQILVQLLVDFLNSDNPALEPLRDAARDTSLIQQFQVDVDHRLRIWPLDDGTPISTGEAYEHSDYGSESDDALE